MKHLYILTILLVLGLSSCENWLDVSPKADVRAEDFYQQEAGYRDGLIGIYSLMTTSYSYGGYLTYSFMDVLAQYYDDLDGVRNVGNFRYAKVYQWDSSNEVSRLSRIWSRAYQGIVNANLALGVIDENKNVFSSEDTYRVYKGEFLALRAMLHFDMLRLFAPSPANGLDAMSIPYSDIYSPETQAQLSISDAIDKIAKDLIEAKELMADVDPYSPGFEGDLDDLPEALEQREIHMNYYAATALLARVYNYVGKSDLALAQASEIIGTPTNSVTSDLFFLTTSPANSSDMLFNSELLFRLDKQNLEEATEPYFFNEDSDPSRQNVLSMTTDDKNAIFPSAEFRSAWMAPTATGGKYSLSKYQEQTIIPLLKLSELYLIAAEASTSESDGLWYLNQLRAYRGLSPVTAELDDEIYREYKREFIGEGQLFFFYKKHLYSTIGSSDDVEIDASKAYVIPLPKAELEFGTTEQ